MQITRRQLLAALLAAPLARRAEVSVGSGEYDFISPIILKPGFTEWPGYRNPMAGYWQQVATTDLSGLVSFDYRWVSLG